MDSNAPIRVPIGGGFFLGTVPGRLIIGPYGSNAAASAEETLTLSYGELPICLKYLFDCARVYAKARRREDASARDEVQRTSIAVDTGSTAGDLFFPAGGKRTGFFRLASDGGLIIGIECSPGKEKVIVSLNDIAFCHFLKTLTKCAPMIIEPQPDQWTLLMILAARCNTKEASLRGGPRLHRLRDWRSHFQDICKWLQQLIPAREDPETDTNFLIAHQDFLQSWIPLASASCT